MHVPKLGKGVLYLSRRDVEEANVPMSAIIDALTDMFKEKGAGRVEMPPKQAFTPNLMLLFMRCQRIYQHCVPQA
jgi:hypothetical protein